MSPALQALLTRGRASHLAQLGQTAVWRGVEFPCLHGEPTPGELSTMPQGYEFGKGWVKWIDFDPTHTAFAESLPTRGDLLTLGGRECRVVEVRPRDSSTMIARLWVAQA